MKINHLFPLFFVLLLLAFCQGCAYSRIINNSLIKAEDYGIIAENKSSVGRAANNSSLLNNLFKKYGGGNNTIMLPKGRTWISASLHIPSRTHFTGHAEGSSIAIAPSFGDAEEGFIENANYNLGNLRTDSFLTLSNITIEGFGIMPLKGQARGVFFNKAKNVKIQGITVINTLLEGIRIDNSVPQVSTENILIEKCRVERRGYGMQNIMLRSFASDAYNNGLQPSRIGQVIIRNNISIGGYHGILSFNAHDVSIEGNHCQANSQRGINISPTNRNITIRNNRVDSAGSTGIILAFSAINIIVDSNHVTNTIADMSGIGIEGQGIKAYVGFSNLTITNNRCNGNATDGIALEGGGAGNDFTISKNTCIGNRRNGIRIWAGELNQRKSAHITNGEVFENIVADNGEDGMAIGSDNNGRGTVKNLRIFNNRVKEKRGKKKYQVENSDRSVKIIN